MKKKQNNLEELKGKSPFKIPEGYMEGLTDQIMSQLPEKPREEAKSVTFMERARPWLYMAAVFAGLGLFFRAIIGLPGLEGNGDYPDSLLVHTEVPANTLHSIYADDEYSEDEEYLDYIEAQYANYILAEEMAFSE